MVDYQKLFGQCGFYSFQKWVQHSVGSFSKLSQNIERSHHRCFLYFDEMDDFVNALIKSSQDCWARIVSSYHMKGWNRDFIRTAYSSKVKEPWLNMIVTGQVETTNKGI